MITHGIEQQLGCNQLLKIKVSSGIQNWIQLQGTGLLNV